MEDLGNVRWRRLPHWDLPGAIYFVTSCLHDSIPAQGRLELAWLRDCGSKANESGVAVDRWKRLFAKCDWWLDHEPAVRHFADAALAAVVTDALYHWAGSRYDLLAFVVMPSHLHWVFRPLEGAGQVGSLPSIGSGGLLPGEGQVCNLPHGTPRSPRERIMHTLKLHSARECNRRLSRRGKFWQDESYDHCVRDDDELERIIQYIEQNPVKAGLAASAEDWFYSSAHDRAAAGWMLGQPLLRLGK